MLFIDDLVMWRASPSLYVMLFIGNLTTDVENFSSLYVMLFIGNLTTDVENFSSLYVMLFIGNLSRCGELLLSVRHVVY